MNRFERLEKEKISKQTLVPFYPTSQSLSNTRGIKIKVIIVM